VPNFHFDERDQNVETTLQSKEYKWTVWTQVG